MLLRKDGTGCIEAVISIMEDEISMLRTKSITRDLRESVSKNREVLKYLKVGVPTFPLWAKQIEVGTKENVEYFWNE